MELWRGWEAGAGNTDFFLIWIIDFGFSFLDLISEGELGGSKGAGLKFLGGKLFLGWFS